MCFFLSRICLYHHTSNIGGKNYTFKVLELSFPHFSVTSLLAKEVNFYFSCQRSIYIDLFPWLLINLSILLKSVSQLNLLFCKLFVPISINMFNVFLSISFFIFRVWSLSTIHNPDMVYVVSYILCKIGIALFLRFKSLI